MLTHRPSPSTALQARRALGLALALCLCATAAGADTRDDWQTWTAAVATGPLGGPDTPWRFWLEGQARFNDDTSRFNQAILRGAVGHALGQRAAVWAGYAFIPTNRPRTDDNLAEHRLWQQLTWSAPAPLAGFSLSTRTRLEQRDVEGASDTAWRFRQLAKLTRPLGTAGRWYLSLWDEVFVHLDDADWGPDAGLDQNRAFAGLGLRLSNVARAEVGYLHQYVDRRAVPDASNHTLSLTLLLGF